MIRRPPLFPAAFLAAPVALLLLAGCNQDAAPSEKVGETVRKAVQVVDGSAALAEEHAGPFAPRDDCAALAGSAEFRALFAAAVAARDAEVLAAMAAEDIKLDSGGGTGRDELVTRLTVDGSDLWGRIAPLADLGCARNAGGGITLPYYFEQRIPIEAALAAIVTGENVPVLASVPDAAAAPGTQGPDEGEAPEPLAFLSWQAVELVPGGIQDGYRRIRYTAGSETEEGFIATSSLRAVLDYRLSAVSRNGRWRIVSLVAGD